MVPFHYGSIVHGSDFCGRATQLAQLTELIELDQNILLQGERRMGKSSLAREAIRRQSRKQALTINLAGVKTVDDVCRAMLYSLFSLSPEGSFLDSLLAEFSHLRPKQGSDPMTGQTTIVFDATVTLQTDAIPGIVDSIGRYSQSRPLALVFDEFQEVLEIENKDAALTELRQQLQQLGAPCLFVSTVHSGINEIFDQPKGLFYKMAATLTVPPLPFKEFSAFLRERFARGQRSVSIATLKKIFALAEKVPGDIQQLCEALWSISSTGDALGRERVIEAIQLVIGREQSSYEIIISRLRSNQMKVLRALSLMGGGSPAASKFVQTAGVANASTVKQALESLASQKIVYCTNKEWKFSNPFFRAWMLHRFIIPKEV